MKENKDKYKGVYCKITKDECTRQYCTVCTYGLSELEAELKDYNEITSFIARRKNDIIFEANLFNTVAKSDSIDNFQLALDENNVWFKNLEPLNDLSSDVLIKSYPHHVIVVEALNLPKATQYYYLKDSSLISVHGDIILAAAPRIDDD